MSKKKNSLAPAIAVVMVLGFITAVCIIATKNNTAPKIDKPAEQSSAASTAQSTLASVQPSQSAQPVSSEQSVAQSKQPTSSTTSYNGIYAGVSWRSSVAVTADIDKHSRNLMLLNKNYELPEDFEWDLVLFSNGKAVDAMSLNNATTSKIHAVDRAAYQPLKDMFAAAKAADLPLEMVSPYRSIKHQDRLFNESVNRYINNGMSKEDAVKKANTSRTFTGTSEHNSGFGFDILEKGNWNLTESFDKTPEFNWLSEHAEEYGFVLRYPADKVDITGIMYEPWHYRYVGVEHAKRMNELDMCLEEYVLWLENEQ